jgi:hypothetical protein
MKTNLNIIELLNTKHNHNISPFSDYEDAKEDLDSSKELEGWKSFSILKTKEDIPRFVILGIDVDNVKFICCKEMYSRVSFDIDDYFTL